MKGRTPLKSSRVRNLAICLAVPLLFVGCAKESDYQNARTQLEDAHLQLRDISSRLNELQGIQKRLDDLKAQAELLQKDVASLQEERDKRTEAFASLSGQMESMQSQIAELREAKKSEDKVRYSNVELKIIEEIHQDMMKGHNFMAPREWFTAHASEPGFATVQAMLVDLSDLLSHSTRAMLISPDEEANDPFENTTVAGLVKLYNEDPDSAVWVAKFWRTKARQGNATYFAAKDKDFREDVKNDTSEEGLKKLQTQYTEDFELELTTYYYDHWKEIREMIMDSLITYEARHGTATEPEPATK